MAESASGKTLEAAKVIGIIGGVLIAGATIKKFTDFFGLTQSEKDKLLEEATKDASQDSTQIQDQSNPYVAFNPNYASAIVTAWQKKYPGLVWNTTKQAKFTQDQYKSFADRIAKSPGTFNDDEDTLYDVFRSLQTQWQLSLLSSFFHTYYNKDLLLFLKGFLSSEEMGDILDMIKNYPQYYK